MIRWIHELLDLLTEYRERKMRLKLEYLAETKVCQTCEMLKAQLDLANHEREKLLSKLVDKPVEIPQTPPEMEPIKSRMIPWHIKRQMLEHEDREKARLIRQSPKPDAIQSDTVSQVEELEKELGIEELRNA